MKSEVKSTTANNFQQLRRLLSQSEEGMEVHIHSKLTQGDIWVVPDISTKFGDKDKHPWVVVRDYKKGRSYVEISPRTTSFNKHDDNRTGIITPAGVIPELNKDGLLLLSHRIKITVDEFRDYIYYGKLPDKWIKKMQMYLRKSVKSSRK